MVWLLLLMLGLVMGELCVELGALVIVILLGMLSHVTHLLSLLDIVGAMLTICHGSISESFSGGMSPLKSLRTLRSMSGMSQRLTFLNALVYVLLRMMIRVTSHLLILVEVLLLLIESRVAWIVVRSGLLVAVIVLILASNHLPSHVSGLTTHGSTPLLLRAKTRVKCLILLELMQRAQYPRVPVPFYTSALFNFLFNNNQSLYSITVTHLPSTTKSF